jgi:hypothetical protein
MSRDIQTSLIVNNVLKAIVVVGMAGTMVVAPNAVQLFGKAVKHLDKRERALKSKRVLIYMQREKLVSFKDLPTGELEVSITEKGKKRIKKLEFDELKITALKSWDMKWRLVMFDIPENLRKSRSALSMKLKKMGFYQLQKSVWAHAYPCEHEINLIQQVFGIPSSCVISAETTNIKNEYKLKQHFNLYE